MLSIFHSRKTQCNGNTPEHSQGYLSEEEIILELQSSDAESSSDDDVTADTEKHLETSPPGNASVWKTILNMLNFIEGVGFLALPYAVRRGGIATAVTSILVPVFFCYTANILVECLYDNDRKRGKVRVRSTFRDLGDVFWPKYGGCLLHVMQQFDLVLYGAEYLVVCGSLLHHALPFVPLTQAMWTGIAGVTVLSTTFFKSLSEIAWLSLISVLAIGVVFFSVVWYGLEHIEEWDAESILFWDTEGFCISFPILVFSYSMFAILPEIEASMADRSKFPRAMSLAYVINTAIKVAFGFLSFFSFGFNTDEVIINNLPAGAVRITVSMIFILSCLLSFTLPLYPVFEKLHQTSFAQAISAKVPSIFIFIGIRCIVVLVVLLLALFLPHFALLIAFTGSSIVSFMSFILPSVVHLKLKYHELKCLQISIDLFFAVFGVIVLVFSVVITGKALIESIYMTEILA